MTIKTVHVDAAQLGPIALRRGFEALSDGDGVLMLAEDGRRIWLAEAVLPGAVSGAFGLDNARPGAVRLRVLGDAPSLPEGCRMVQLVGSVKFSAWYTPRARGAAARSALTLTAERVHAAPAGSRPTVRGGIPVVLPEGVEAMLLGADDGTADVMLSAMSSYTVDGVAQVRTGSVPDALFGSLVRPVGLRAFWTAPDAEDVGQRTKAELILSASGFEPAEALPALTNGRGKREAVAAVAAAGEASQVE